jgi:hypothetical protein
VFRWSFEVRFREPVITLQLTANRFGIIPNQARHQLGHNHPAHSLRKTRYLSSACWPPPPHTLRLWGHWQVHRQISLTRVRHDIFRVSHNRHRSGSRSFRWPGIPSNFGRFVLKRSYRHSMRVDAPEQSVRLFSHWHWQKNQGWILGRVIKPHNRSHQFG